MPTPQPVFEIAGSRLFSGEKTDFIDAGNPAALNLGSGTFSMAFRADKVWGRNTLFSKDGHGYDNGGHLTAWIDNGYLKVRQQSNSDSKYMKVRDLKIEAGRDYHVSVSFGAEGLKIHLNGLLIAAEPAFKLGIDANERSLLIGSSGIHRHDDTQTPKYPFQGEISDVKVFGTQLSGQDAAAIAGQSDPMFAMHSGAMLDAEDLMPAFAQAHHGSDELKQLAQDAGWSHHGHIMDGTAVYHGTDGADTIGGSNNREAINAGHGDDVVEGNGGADLIQGGYGNDVIRGGADNDVLDGGHGEDIVDGGEGDDILISQADGREGAVYFDPNRDEGIDAYSADQLTGKVYLNQPIHADDIFTGGAGADVFYFQTLINAKQKYLEKHTQDDGTIRWHGVAGENDNIHNHWVDIIGNDLITDFNRAEGDRIVIEGHTTEIHSIVHADANGDGVMDNSVIRLYSDQGNGGGAHNDDLLGSITVFGDLVHYNDIEHTAKPAYGIVKNADKLAEAITPLAPSVDAGARQIELNLDTSSTFKSASGASAAFALEGALTFDGQKGGEFIQGHSGALNIHAGTVAFSFRAADISGRDALFSKDAKGFGTGGHLSAFVESDGDLKVRFQTASGEKWFTLKHAIAEGLEYDFAFTFGADGTYMYLNGQLVAGDATYLQSWHMNNEVLLIGANGWSSKAGEVGRPNQQFNGEITNFAIYGEQMDIQGIQGLAQFDDTQIV